MMPTRQKLTYDAVRAFGYAYVSTDSDGTTNLIERPCAVPPPHRVAVDTDGTLYEITAARKWRCVSYR